MELKDWLHYYIGCDLRRGGILTHRLLKAAQEASFDAWTDLTPCLRPISDMTEEEIQHLVWLAMDSDQLDDDCRVTKEEIGVDKIQWSQKGVRKYWHLEVDCRCFTGFFCIDERGNVKLVDEENEIEDIDNQAAIMHYLISRGFNLFDPEWKYSTQKPKTT